MVRKSGFAAAGSLVLGGVVVAQVLAAGPASAHDELISTDPAPSSTVATVPSAVTLTFAEPPLTLGMGVDVTGPAGSVSTGAPTLSGKVVRQAVQPGAQAGSYTVRWRVTADDGHPVSGSFTFVASAPSAGGQSPAPVSTIATTATAVAAGGADERDMPSPLLWWGIVGAAVVLVIAAGTLAVTRTRSRGAAEDTDHTDEADMTDTA